MDSPDAFPRYMGKPILPFPIQDFPNANEFQHLGLAPMPFDLGQCSSQSASLDFHGAGQVFGQTADRADFGAPGQLDREGVMWAQRRCLEFRHQCQTR